jgi:anaerobic selenocysteine-containing dehydrogenase
MALLQLAIHNVANYSPPIVDLPEGELEEWEILAKLALIFQGAGADADPAVVDDLAIRTLVDHALGDESGPFHGCGAEEVLGELGDRRGPARLVDFMLRTGPYGLSLDELLDQPHGVDLGPLQPRLPDALRTPTGMIELAPEVLVDDVARLQAVLDGPHTNGHDALLIGRRQLRSNNSWMHNLTVLVKGKPRCTLHVHPDDAGRLGLEDGKLASVASRTGTVAVAVEVTDGIMPGVVSIPHGWGHDVDGVQMAVAATMAGGVNSNLLADEDLFDPVSGNAVLNGIPVTVKPV